MSHVLLATARFWLTQISIALLLLPVAAAVVVLPGALPALFFRRRLDASSATLLPMAAGISIAVLGVFAEIAYFARLTLTAAFVAFGVTMALVAAALWKRAEWRGITWRREPWILAGITCALSLVQGAWTTGDSAYHLAATRSLLVFDRPLVTDPYYGTSNMPIDSISGSWHTMMALVSRLTHLDILTLWPSLTALGAVILVLGFWSLAAEAAGSTRAATLATIAMLVVEFLTDFRDLAYPGFLSRGLLFIAIWALLRALSRPSVWAALAAGLLGSAAAAVHLGTAEMYLLAGAAVLVASAIAVAQEWRRGSPARAAWLAAAGGVVAAVASVAPVTAARVSTISTMDLAPVGFELWRRYQRVFPGLYLPRPLWFRAHVNQFALGALPTVALGVVSFIVLGLMVREAIRSRSSLAWGSAGLVGLPILLAAPPLSLLIIGRSEYMLVRLLDVLGALVFVGVAWALARTDVWQWLSARRLAIAYVAVALLCALPSLPGVYRGVAQMWAGDRRLYWGAEQLAQLKTALGPRYPRVASDVGSGYAMLAFAQISLVAGHPVHSPYYVELTDGAKRRQDMASLLDTATPSQTRLALMQRWDADFVLISPATPDYKKVLQSFQADPTAFSEVLTTKRLWLFAPAHR